MFADSLLPTGHSRRPWTTLASFVIQALGLTVLLALPIFYGEGLPQVRLRDLLLTPPPAAAAIPHPAANRRVVSAAPVPGQLTTPSVIPVHIDLAPDSDPAPEIDISAMPSGVYQGPRAGVLRALSPDFSRIAPPAVLKPAAISKTPPISRWMEGNLIRKVQPIYPAIARSAGIQGSVVLRALINREGKIEQVNVVNGHPMLVKAAVDAVSLWLYRPYYLNDQPVEVETQVTVNFTLAR